MPVLPPLSFEHGLKLEELFQLLGINLLPCPPLASLIGCRHFQLNLGAIIANVVVVIVVIVTGSIFAADVFTAIIASQIFFKLVI